MSNLFAPRSPLGSCWSCVDDLVMPSTMATGQRCVAEAIARRWATPRGGLVGDTNYGYDLTDFISDDLDRAGLAAISHQAAIEAKKDERVLTCSVTVTSNADGTLSVVAGVTTAAGPFQLVGTVTDSNFILRKVA